MSVKLISAAYKADLPKGPKATLLALADMANRMGETWPSVSTLMRRTGRGERSVQGDIQYLADHGHITREERAGTTSLYLVHPRKPGTPAEFAPPLPLRLPPQNLRGRGAESAPIPSKNLLVPSLGTKRKASPKPIQDDWQPADFSEGTESAKVIAGWPIGEKAAQLEQFKAHHSAKGNCFIDPQKAWSTWVLGSRRFGTGRQGNSGNSGYVSASGHEYRGNRAAVKREAEKRADWSTYWKIEGEEKREREARALTDH